MDPSRRLGHDHQQRQQHSGPHPVGSCRVGLFFMDCVQESTALAAGAALISAGMTISARLRTEQLSIFFDCRVWSNRAIAGLTGTGWGWDRHGQTSSLMPF